MLFKVEAGEAMLIGKSAELCLFTPSLKPEANPDTVVVNYAKDYVFSSPEKKVAEVPLVFPLEPDTESLQHMNVMVWWSPVVAYRMGSKYDSWFSERLGYPVIFVYIGENKRKVLGSMTPRIAARQQWEQSNFSGKASIVLRNLIASFSRTAVDEGISFADVAPYLIVSEKSRENVQNRLAKGASMDITKFRPNIVVEGAQTAYEEDYWNELQIGSQVKMTLTQGCARCSSINIDYNTGKFGDGEEGTVFKKLQKDRRVDAGLKFNPVFGKYAFLNRLPQGKTSAEIKVGDEIKVLKRNKHRSEFGQYSHITLRFIVYSHSMETRFPNLLLTLILVWPGITTYSLDDTRNVKKKEGAPR